MQRQKWQHQWFCFRRTVPSNNAFCQKTSLTLLLENEDYLLKILSYLVEDGLHECCLVCHRWRDACRTLQRRLFVSRNDALMTAIKRSPKTETLRLDLTMEAPSKGQQGRYPSQEILHERLQFCFTMHTLDALMLVTQLRHLEMIVQKAAIPVARIEASFRQLKQLKSLSFSTIECTESELRIVAVVRQLTALTALRIDVPVKGWVIFDPMPELNNIQELHVNHFCFLTNGKAPLFPSLSDLRHLTLSDRFHPLPVDLTRHGDPIQLLSVYASSLESLHVPVIENRMTHHPSLFTQFLRLRTLCIDGRHFAFQELVVVLRSCPRLTELDIDLPRMTRMHLTQLWEVTSMKLKSLILRSSSGVNPVLTVHHFPSLERLRVTESAIESSSLSQLSNLRSLWCHGFDDDPSGFSEALMGLTKLEELRLTCESYPGFHFEQLPKLRSVSLSSRTDVSTLFDDLQSLMYLTKLEVGFATPPSALDVSQLNRLTNLVGLKIVQLGRSRGSWLRKVNGLWFHRVRLPQLRYLCLVDVVLRKKDKSQLHKKFPSLRVTKMT